MKRKGKCVNKKSYSYRHVAINVASIWFKRNGSKFGIYECSTCLDFHLTSKYCNLEHSHAKWAAKRGVNPKKSAIAVIRKRNRKEWKYKRFLICHGLLPTPKPKLKRSKSVTLAQAEMTRIFSTFDSTVYPQPVTLFSRILGIIIDKSRPRDALH